MMDSVVDAYPLNATHRGILFHSLQNEVVDVYLSVISLRIQGNLDISLLQQAWQHVFTHHPSLRSAVVFDGLDDPLWVVHDSIKPALEHLDFASYTSAEQISRERVEMDKLLQTRFEFAAEALMKFTLIKIDDNTHRLLWAVHHILSDGWSTSVVLEDLSTAYAALVRAQTPSLPPALAYGQFLNEQSKLDLDPLRAYWSAYLSGKESTPLMLVESVRKSEEERLCAVETQLHFDENRTRIISEAARRFKTTNNVLLIAAWGIVLRDLCQHTSPLFGVTLAGRSANLPSIDRGVGLYASTLPFFINTTDTKSIKDWLKSISQSLQNHAEHDSISLADIKKLAQHQSDEPLFSTVVALSGHESNLCFGSCMNNDIQIDAVDCQIRSHFDVSLLVKAGKQISLTLVSQTDKLDKENSNEILRRYVQVLELLADSTFKSVQALLQGWQNSGEEYTVSGIDGTVPPHQRIDEWVLDVASQQPTNIALLQGQTRMTYAELVRKARQISFALNSIVPDHDRPIAICLSNSINAVVTMVGVLLSDRFYLPLDAQQPAERLAQVCKNADCALIISDQLFDKNTFRNNEFCWQNNGDLSSITTTLETLLSQCKSDNNVVSHSGTRNEQSSAYLMYTSGSTGAPKGVLISHTNLVYSTQARFNYYTNNVKQFLLVSPLHFDSSVVGLYWTLCDGGTIVLPEQVSRTELAHWSELVREHHISHVLCLPSVYRLWIGQSNVADLQSLESVIVAGEPCHADLCATHYQKLPKAELFNEYGPTEACVWSSVHRCRDKESHAVPIGQPIPGTSIKIVGVEGAVCPDGVEGELQLFSQGVANGYYKQPELTAESFSSDPPGYRTGDLGYYSRSGQLFCTGRVDRQLKIRGHRIEPAEIELVVRQIDGVDDVRAFSTTRSSENSTRLWLAYTPESVPVDRIKSTVQSYLPAPMWPHGYLALQSLPTLSNGKVSERSLVDLLTKTNSVEHVSQAVDADSEVGIALLDMVNILLGENTASITNNAMQCGLDSIDAMKLTAQLRQRFDIDLRLASVLDSSNWGDLASRIELLLKTEVASSAPIETTNVNEELPLSAPQLPLWFLDQTELPPNVYAVQSTFRCVGKLCMPAVRYALNALVHQHEILRTRFRTNDTGDAYQAIMPAESVELTVIDHVESGLAWEQVRDNQLIKRFDLECDQLFRALVYRCQNEDHLLMFHSHHIVMDGWSFDVLQTQFAKHYRVYIEAIIAEDNNDDQSITVSMPKPDELQYREFTLWQNDILNKVLQSETEHWAQVLAEPRESLELAHDFSRPIHRTFNGGSVVRSIDSHITEHWANIAHNTQATSFMVALAAVKTGLRALFGNSDLLIGTPVTNRVEQRWQNMLGFFGNTVVVRTKGLKNDTFVESVRQTRSATLDALNHDSVPFDHIVRELGLQGARNRHPLFDVFFMYKHQYESMPAMPNVNLELVSQEELTTAKFDLAIEIRPQGISNESGYELHLNYSTDLFLTKTIESLAEELLSVMSATASVPNKPVNELMQTIEPDYSSAFSSLPIHESFSNDDAGLQLNQRLDQVFHTQRLRYPGSVALQHNGYDISYEVLDKLVDQIVEALQQCGVVPGEVIIVSLPRSFHQIAAMLAISRCEAVWCPVDPNYPQNRKQYMYSDSSSRILISASPMLTEKTIPDNMIHIVVEPGENPANAGVGPVVLGDKQPRLSDLSACQHRLRNRAAVLMYTSGSMGNPKGVLLGHHALMNRFLWMWNRYPFAENDINVIKTSSSFVDSVWECFGALLAGTPSILVNDSDVTNIESFVRILSDSKVTRLLLVPSLLTSMLDWLSSRDQNLPSLKLCSCSGEVLPTQLATKLLTIQPHTRLLNLYGSTEVAADVTCQEIVLAKESEYLPLGSAIDGISMHILDENRREVAPGVSGEIASAGLGLAIGYHNDAELNAQKFVEVNGIGRVFLSGDAGHLDELGRLHFDGRNDRQIKVRGIRVNCHHIEQQISSIPGVAHSLVFAHGELDERQLCAVVQRNDASRDAELLDRVVLLSHLQKMLPEHQLPDRFWLVDSLPLLPNGKPDRQAAIELVLEQSDIGHSINQPASNDVNYHVAEYAGALTGAVDHDIHIKLQQHMLAIWQDTLKNRDLCIDDDFFEAGGYSLLAVKLVMRVNSEVLAQYDSKMTIGDLLEKRTISEIVKQQVTNINRANIHVLDSRSEILMTLNAGTGLRQLFMVPPFGDTGFFFSKFATCVPKDISVYSFDMSISVEHDSLQSVCSALVDEVLTIQSKGPWVIAAGCLGNVLAFEMAHQIKNRTGVDCELFLIDSDPPRKGPGWNHVKVQRTGFDHFWTILRKEFTDDYCRKFVRMKVRRLRAVFDEGIRKYLDVQLSQSNQFVKYQAQKGSSDITLFLSNTFLKRPLVADRWAQLTTGEFKLHDFPDISHEKLLMVNSSHWSRIAKVVLQSQSLQLGNTATLSEKTGRHNAAQNTAIDSSNDLPNIKSDVI